MIKRLIFFTFTIFSLCAAYAQIESTHIRDIFNYLPESNLVAPADIVVLLDLDNTVCEPDDEDGIGSDQFVTYLAKQKMAESGLDFNHAQQEVLPYWFALMNHINMIPVEQETPDAIKELQTKGMHVLALTARSLPLQYRTIEQLANINIDFTTSGFSIPNNTLDIHLTNISKYYQGIIFCNANCKGLVLLKFFEIINYRPKLVIFVDDKAHNIQVVEKMLEEHGIHVIGIRYGRLDHKAENFNPLAANKKFRFFVAGLESQIA